jgi:hypothetical protein
MKLAVLGYTPAAIAFLQQALRLGHEVRVAYDAGGGKQELRDAVPTIRLRDDWEDLLGEREIDALIVAGPSLPEDVPSDVQERRDDQLRKLIQAGVPLVIIPPVCEAIVGFELEMIRRDVQGVIVPAWGGPLHPAINDLLDCHDSHSAKAAPLGKAELVSIERSLPLRTRSRVLAAFAHDAEILRRIAGPFKRLTATGASSQGESKPSLSNLSVHAEGDVPIRWSVGMNGDSSRATLSEVGSEGSITLSMPDQGGWQLAGPGLERSYDPHDSVAALIGELQSCLEHSAQPRITWLDACRAVEAMEAIDRSIARNRAIELYNEEPSEESSFKGIMAASGCLMLLGTLAALSCAGGLAIFFPPGKRTGALGPEQYGQFHSYWTWLQVCLIVPLAAFLLVQLLSFGLSRHLRNKQPPAAKIAD